MRGLRGSHARARHTVGFAGSPGRASERGIAIWATSNTHAHAHTHRVERRESYRSLSRAPMCALRQHRSENSQKPQGTPTPQSQFGAAQSPSPEGYSGDCS